MSKTRQEFRHKKGREHNQFQTCNAGTGSAGTGECSYWGAALVQGVMVLGGSVGREGAVLGRGSAASVGGLCWYGGGQCLLRGGRMHKAS